MNLAGKRVLITGGTRGIGKATAEAFLRHGARVAINGTSAASVDAALHTLNASGRAFGVPGDLSKLQDCQDVVKTALARLDGLDVLVNNAGITGGGKPFETATPEDWERSVNVNVRAVYFCTQYALPALRSSQGNVINLGSVLALGGRGTGVSLYCTTKGAVVNLTRDLAIELAPDVRVNCVCPGAIDTDMLQEVAGKLADGDIASGYAKMVENRPIKRVARPEEIANAILYLASDMASFVTGSIHTVDGGVTAKLG
jgi:NAD(P)-dependent dehydrogenase (short-subunit alcohol dehydrogenase family)